MASAIQVINIILASLVFMRHRAAGQAADTREDNRPKQIAGYPIDQGYRLQNRGPQQFVPVTEESSREQQYLRDQDQPRDQQQPLFTPDQQALLQQHYQNYAQLLNQQQQYLSSTQHQQVQQQQQLQQQYQPLYPHLQQNRQPPQQQSPVQQPTLQQQRQLGDSQITGASLLGVKFSAAPSVAHTMFRSNTGVSFSY